MFKSIIKQFIPPIFLDAVRKHKSKGMSFINYGQALSHGDSYEQDDVIRVVVNKGKEYERLIKSQTNFELSRLRIVVGILAAVENNTLNVLDFGGGAGADYYLIKKLVGGNIAIDWRVVETEPMARKAKENGLEHRELSFFSSIAEAVQDKSSFDMVLSSCSINYTSEPLITLNEIMNINSRYFYFTRTPMSLKRLNRPVILQRSKLSSNGYGPTPKWLSLKDKEITYPVTILFKDEFESVTKKFGHIVIQVNEERKAYFSSEGSFDLFGYLIEKK